MASRKLNMDGQGDTRQPIRKRKSKPTNPVMQTPDLNAPALGPNVIVPVSLVNSRVNQLDASPENSGGSLIETLKKQKRGSFSQNARSAAAVSSSPHRAQ